MDVAPTPSSPGKAPSSPTGPAAGAWYRHVTDRGSGVDAARADAEAARARGVSDLSRAGELRWAQDADRVALFLPVAEDTKARSIDIDVTPRALSLSVGGAQILERAPLRHGVDGEGSSWTLEDVAARCLVLELPKLDDAIVWASLLDGRSREELSLIHI